MKKQKIAIIGSGNIGSALATGLSAAGHDVTLGVRNPEQYKNQDHLNLVTSLKKSTIENAALNSEVIIICTPAHVVPELILLLGDVSNKVIIDATNAVRIKPEPYQTAFEAIQKNSGAEVMKCFNSTGFENLVNPIYRNQQNDEVRLDMFMAGSSMTGKTITRALAMDMGFAECYDFGGDDKVPLLEQFALAWINLAIMQGNGRNIAFKILKRSE